ncbi:hypothetical protein B0H13DRAFT_1892676 [Mycena leptocephala]|nr:hypothetical protein B0H13DRAFT_1892676 [Mycena leptocephala]
MTEEKRCFGVFHLNFGQGLRDGSDSRAETQFNHEFVRIEKTGIVFHADFHELSPTHGRFPPRVQPVHPCRPAQKPPEPTMLALAGKTRRASEQPETPEKKLPINDGAFHSSLSSTTLGSPDRYAPLPSSFNVRWAPQKAQRPQTITAWSLDKICKDEVAWVVELSAPAGDSQRPRRDDTIDSLPLPPGRPLRPAQRCTRGPARPPTAPPRGDVYGTQQPPLPAFPPPPPQQQAPFYPAQPQPARRVLPPPQAPLRATTASGAPPLALVLVRTASVSNAHAYANANAAIRTSGPVPLEQPQPVRASTYAYPAPGPGSRQKAERSPTKEVPLLKRVFGFGLDRGGGIRFGIQVRGRAGIRGRAGVGAGMGKAAGIGTGRGGV